MTGAGRTRVIGGRYVVLGELPRQGAGTVWRAADRVTGRQVAVAELHLPGGPDADERRLVRERLLRAARATARIAHPGVVPVHDVVTDDDVDHIVTDLVDAPTLADRVAADGPLDPCAATATARQLAAALQAVHAAEVVHGGITPRAVVLGTDGRARLAALGVAEAVDPRRETRDPAFLAPELRAGGPATPAADLWALGATLHVALHGVPPEAAGGPGPAAGAGAVDSVLAALLQPVPQDRPSARRVAAALDARPVPGAGRGRWRWVTAAAVLGLLAGLGGGLLLAGAGDRRVPTLSHGAGGDVRIAGTVDGACLAAVPGPGTATGTADCAGPHEAEVFAGFDPYAGRDVPYPGRPALDGFAADACPAAFEAVVPGDRSGLALLALVPAPAAFEAGDRAVHCLLHQADGSALTGSRVGGKRG